MTLPTSKQRMPIFPEQRAHMASHVHGSPPDISKPGPTLLPSGDGNAWHQEKMDLAHKMVMARLHENSTKQAVYLGTPNFNRLRAAPEKTRRTGDKYKKMHGGVFTSKMGQEWGMQRLKDRVNELNVRASAAFGVEAQQAPPTAPPGKSAAEMDIEVAFTTLFDSVQAVEITNMVPAANKILSLLYSSGAKVGVNEAISYLKYAQDIRRDLVAALEQSPNILGDAGGVNIHAYAAAKKRVIKTAIPVMDRIQRLLDLIVKTGNLNQDERTLAINSSKGRDVAEAKTRFDNVPKFSNPSKYYTGMYKVGFTGRDAKSSFETEERVPGFPEPGAQRELVEAPAEEEEAPSSESESETSETESESGSEDEFGPMQQAPRTSPRSNKGVPPSKFKGEGRRRRSATKGRSKGGCNDCDETKSGYGRRQKKKSYYH